MADTEPPNPAWQRLGEKIVDRRVELGYLTRPAFAKALSMGTRILADLERGLRDNYDRTTLARVEQTLDWKPGSIASIIGGGEPTPRQQARHVSDDVRLADSANAHVTPAPRVDPGDEALARVMRSSLSEARKRQLVALLLAEKAAAERRHVERAEELIVLFRNAE